MVVTLTCVSMLLHATDSVMCHNKDLIRGKKFKKNKKLKV